MTNEPRDLLKILKAAVKGLTYPSESDEPFDVLRWDNPKAASARDALLPRIDCARRIEQVSPQEFFDRLADSEDRERFRRLHEILLNLLRDVAVFRVGAGEIRVDVYLIGHLPTGSWAGLHTVSVET